MRIITTLLLSSALLACSPAATAESPQEAPSTPSAPAAITPQARMQAFRALPQDTPISALSLIRVHDRAQYVEGDPEFGTPAADVSGRVAVQRYFDSSEERIRSLGGEVRFVEDVEQIFMGLKGDDWDVVALVHFPDRETFLAVISGPEFAEISRHRRAGIAEHKLIHTSSAGDR